MAKGAIVVTSPEFTSPDSLDLKFLRELEDHRGFGYLTRWISRERERKAVELEKCKPEELGELQGFIRALRLVEQGREQCEKELSDRLARTGRKK